MTTQVPLLNIADYEARARETMPKALFARLFGERGAADWMTNTNNVAAFDRLTLRPRVLVDVSNRDLTTEVLGKKNRHANHAGAGWNAPTSPPLGRTGISPGRRLQGHHNGTEH